MTVVKGSFQVPVIRFLAKKSHAIDLAKRGRARFTRLQLFQDVDGARSDDSEGVGRLARGKVRFVSYGQAPVEAAVESEATNPMYILCFSEASADLPRLAQEFECAYGVEFADPDLLNRALPATTFDTILGRELVNIRVEEARYDKDLAGEGIDLRSAVSLAFMQKPVRFEHEKEWRLVVVLSGPKFGAPDYLFGNIPLGREATIRRFEFTA